MTTNTRDLTEARAAYEKLYQADSHDPTQAERFWNFAKGYQAAAEAIAGRIRILETRLDFRMDFCEGHATGQGEDEIDRLNHRIAALESDLAAARGDAQRYRWLRDKSAPENSRYYVETNCRLAKFVSDEIDAAIDAAMADGTKEKK